MKNVLYWVVFFIIVSSSFVFAQERDFAKSLGACSEYFGSQTIELDNVKMTTTKQILGFQGGVCVYKESGTVNDVKYCATCKFNKKQLAELAKVLTDFDNSSESKNIDVNDFAQVQESPVATAWTKYLQDPSTCTIEIE